jgi:hypothetical protein
MPKTATESKCARDSPVLALKLASVPILELVIFAFGKNDGNAVQRH